MLRYAKTIHALVKRLRIIENWFFFHGNLYFLNIQIQMIKMRCQKLIIESDAKNG